MKFYVATKAENWPAARKAIELIQDTGHEVTHDWTVDVETWGPMGSAQEREPKSDSELAALAQADIDGVRGCHVNLHIPHPGLGGTFVEMGAALALHKLVWVLGDVVQWHPFYKLPNVWHINHTSGDDRLEVLEFVLRQFAAMEESNQIIGEEALRRWFTFTPLPFEVSYYG